MPSNLNDSPRHSLPDSSTLPEEQHGGTVPKRREASQDSREWKEWDSMDAANAYDRGYAHGTTIGSWYFDGNTPDAIYRRVLDGIENGDPAILDTFPSFSFGEWAGESAREIFGTEYDEWSDEERDEYLDTYLVGFDAGVSDMIEVTARQHVEG